MFDVIFICRSLIAIKVDYKKSFRFKNNLTLQKPVNNLKKVTLYQLMDQRLVYKKTSNLS